MTDQRRLGLGYGLSERETAVVELMAVGHTNSEIGQALNISINTVIDRVRAAKQKTGTADRDALVEWWMAHPNAGRRA